MTDDEADNLMMRITRKAAEGCCMDDKWRGHACGYHEGFYDGADAFWWALKEGERTDGSDWLVEVFHARDNADRRAIRVTHLPSGRSAVREVDRGGELAQERDDMMAELST